MRLYIVTRRDLPIGAQAAQSCHAMHSFLEEHGGAGLPAVGTTLVCLTVPDEDALLRLTWRLHGTTHSVFREPDLGNAVTAVATTCRGPLRNLPLLGAA